MDIINEHVVPILECINNINQYYKFRQEIDKPILLKSSKDLVATNQNEIEKEQQEMKYKGITIHKNKNCNTWYTRFRRDNKIIYITGKTQKECYSKLKKAYNSENIEKEIKKEEIKPTITLLQWYNQWLELYKIGKVKQTTLDDYKKSYKKLPIEILNKNIQDIRVADIIKTLNNCEKERTRQKLYDFLNMIFQKAEDNEIIVKNILTRIDKPKHIKQNSQPLTIKQETEFINACKQVKHGDYFLVCLYQGLRKGECLALTRADIDFEKKTLLINKSINANNKIDTTKNNQSIRTAPLFDKTIKILEKYKEIKGRIFNFSPKIQKITMNNINKLLNFHVKTKDLRSTFVTRCQEQNIPEFIIQSWVGHKIGSKVTKSVYTKYNAEDNIKYINIINQKNK